jgi:hypothetical protein
MRTGITRTEVLRKTGGNSCLKIVSFTRSKSDATYFEVGRGNYMKSQKSVFALNKFTSKSLSKSENLTKGFFFLKIL